jgi:hypothetical protein
MKIILTKNQKRIAFTVLGLLLIVIISLIFIKKKSPSNVEINSKPEEFQVIFLDEAEKASLNIKPEAKIQVLQRDATGKVILYKAIKNDTDVVNNLDEIKAVSPNTRK